MNILVLPNALKGSLRAVDFVDIARRVLSPAHNVCGCPISDGGDGFIDFFKMVDPHARWISCTAKNAFLKNRKTGFLVLSDGKTAVVETARICGLGSANKQELDPLGASSYGVGQVLVAAVKRGVKTIYVGLGGVACNDGGAGMSVACGAVLSAKNGAALALGADALLQLKKIDLTRLHRQFRGVKIIGVADVKNPLLGRASSAKVFGPQKGATPAQVKRLDKAMAVWAREIYKATGVKLNHAPSTAAAGAIAAGLAGCFGAQLCLGADELLRRAKLAKQFRRADLIITAEGKLDTQTFYGKAPLAVLKLAKKFHKPVLFICGALDETVLRRRTYLPDQLAVLGDFAPTPEASRCCAARYLRRVLKQLL